MAAFKCSGTSGGFITIGNAGSTSRGVLGAGTNVMGNVGVGDFGIVSEFGAVILGANNTEQLRIAVGGNVGIGISNPAYRLDVAGSARIAGLVKRSWQYSGTFLAAPLVVVDLNIILPQEPAGFLPVALIQVGGTENGATNVTFGLWMCIKHVGGFSVQKVSEFIVGNGHGTPILSVSGSNLMIINAAGSEIGAVWRLSFSAFAA